MPVSGSPFEVAVLGDMVFAIDRTVAIGMATKSAFIHRCYIFGFWE